MAVSDAPAEELIRGVRVVAAGDAEGGDDPAVEPFAANDRYALLRVTGAEPAESAGD